MARLTEQVQRWAKTPMRPGEGLHVDIFRAAIFMLEDGHDEATIFNFLRQAANRVLDRTIPDRELFGAIASAKARLNGGTTEGRKWPPFDERLRNEIIANPGVTQEQLAIEGDRLPQDPSFYLGEMYRENDFVCIGETAYQFTTHLRPVQQTLVAARACEYVNPSPMTAEFGITKDVDLTGNRRASAHCLDNCGPKTWQVVEFDHGTVAEHVALHWFLAKSAPLALLVYSGGKSLHGWYNVRGRSEADVAAFFGSAVQLGADPKMWSRCQFSRLPAGRNSKNGRCQMVLLFCPSHV